MLSIQFTLNTLYINKSTQKKRIDPFHIGLGFLELKKKLD